MNEAKAPKDIQFDSIVVDISCHPQRDVIAAGQIEGDVTIHTYSVSEENHLLMTLPHHKKACRALAFSLSGDRLFTASKDKSLQMIDMEQGSVVHAIKNAHKSALYSLLVVDPNIVATGDDDGCLKVWDMRQQKAVMDCKENEEFISDMLVDDSQRILLATSGEGTLTAFDIRKHKMKMQSELFEAELLSVAAFKRGEKLVCGDGEGCLNIFNWGEWNNFCERFPGHPSSIDCILPVTERIILTGSTDGIIRAVHLQPNQFMGVVGEHEEFPVENLAKSRCGCYLVSCSHDQCVKFWNIEKLPDEKIDGGKKAKKASKTKKLTPGGAQGGFFSDLGEGQSEAAGRGGESDEESDHDTDSDSNMEDSDSDNEADDLEKNDEEKGEESDLSDSENEVESEKTEKVMNNGNKSDEEDEDVAAS